MNRMPLRDHLRRIADRCHQLEVLSLILLHEKRALPDEPLAHSEAGSIIDRFNGVDEAVYALTCENGLWPDLDEDE